MRKLFLATCVVAIAMLCKVEVHAGITPPDQSNFECYEPDDGIAGVPECCCFMTYSSSWNDWWAPTGWTSTTMRFKWNCDYKDKYSTNGIYSCTIVFDCGPSPEDMTRPIPRHEAPCGDEGCMGIGMSSSLFVYCTLYDQMWCP